MTNGYHYGNLSSRIQNCADSQKFKSIVEDEQVVGNKVYKFEDKIFEVQ